MEARTLSITASLEARPAVPAHAEALAGGAKRVRTRTLRDTIESGGHSPVY